MKSRILQSLAYETKKQGVNPRRLLVLCFVLMLFIVLTINTSCTTNSKSIATNDRTVADTNTEIEHVPGTATIGIRAVDDKTETPIPTENWSLVSKDIDRIIKEKQGKKDAIKIVKQADKLLYYNMPLGEYMITIQAEGYCNEEYGPIRVFENEEQNYKIQIVALPQSPQTSEEAVYQEFKKNYAFNHPLYRPTYLPGGYTIAPYYCGGWNENGRSAQNPSYSSKYPAAAVAYSNGTDQIVLRFAQEADIGDIPGVEIDGRKVYYSQSADGNSIMWYENGYLYSVGGLVSKEEITKVYKSLEKY